MYSLCFLGSGFLYLPTSYIHIYALPGSDKLLSRLRKDSIQLLPGGQTILPLQLLGDREQVERIPAEVCRNSSGAAFLSCLSELDSPFAHILRYVHDEDFGTENIVGFAGSLVGLSDDLLLGLFGFRFQSSVEGWVPFLSMLLAQAALIVDLLTYHANRNQLISARLRLATHDLDVGERCDSVLLGSTIDYIVSKKPAKYLAFPENATNNVV